MNENNYIRKLLTIVAIVWGLLLIWLISLMLSHGEAEGKPFLETALQAREITGTWSEYSIDGIEWKIGNRELIDGMIKLRQDMAPEALPDGEHIFEVRHCNVWECGEVSDPLADIKQKPEKAAQPSLVGE